MTTTAAEPTGTAPHDARPRAATGPGHLLRAEIGRLRRRRLVLLVLGLAGLALVGSMVAVFFSFNQDVAGARARAVVQAEQANRDQARFRQDCLADPSIPDAAKQAGACGPEAVEPMTADGFYQDPRLRADVGLPGVALGVAVGMALVGALIGATAVGADWSSRALLTLITWEPRRLRLLAARFTAIAIFAALAAVVAQAAGLALAALTVQLRGTWQASPAPSENGPSAGPAIIGPANFWRDLVSLQVRGVGLVVAVALVAAAVTMMTRHTAALLGLAFAWVAVVENAVRLLLGARGWSRWLVTENVGAYLYPGGQRLLTRRTRTGDGSWSDQTVLVSNLDALLYLGVITAVLVVASGLLLRRRDL